MWIFEAKVKILGTPGSRRLLQEVYKKIFKYTQTSNEKDTEKYIFPLDA